MRDSGQSDVIAPQTIFPAEIEVWRCPACHKKVCGRIDVDENAPRCRGKWHLTTPIARQYVLVNADMPDHQAARR